jgi:hypothetical protein
MIELDKEIDNLKSRIKQQFTDQRHYGYRLHSVFIHRGTIHFTSTSNNRRCRTRALLDLYLRFRQKSMV